MDALVQYVKDHLVLAVILAVIIVAVIAMLIVLIVLAAKSRKNAGLMKQSAPEVSEEMPTDAEQPPAER